MNCFEEIAYKLSTLTGAELAFFIIAQIVGVINTVLAVVIGQVRKKRTALIIMTLMNVLMLVSELLLKAWTAAVLCAVAAVVSLIVFFIREKGERVPGWFIALSALLFAGSTLLSFPGASGLLGGKTDLAGFAAGVRELGALRVCGELLPVIGSMTCLWGIAAPKPSVYRVAMLLNGVIWLLHDLYVMNYGIAITHILQIGSYIVGIIRLDFLKRGEKKNV